MILKQSEVINSPGITENMKDRLANVVKEAIGNRSVSMFAKDCRMVEVDLIINILNKKIKVLPEREVLRTIERASQGRVTYSLLCDICGYTKFDPNEDRSWANFFPDRGSIYNVDLGFNNQDSEQNGVRPCLIISNNKGNEKGSIITIAPLTTKEKRPMPTHVKLTTKDGMRQDSLICLEQIRTVTKRRLFYNRVPIKILDLSEEKIFEVNTAIEKQLGLINVLFNEDIAFELIEQIEILKKNIKVKQSRDLIELLDEKISEFATYCKKYQRNIQLVMNEYERLENCCVCAI